MFKGCMVLFVFCLFARIECLDFEVNYSLDGRDNCELDKNGIRYDFLTYTKPFLFLTEDFEAIDSKVDIIRAVSFVGDLDANRLLLMELLISVSGAIYNMNRGYMGSDNQDINMGYSADESGSLRYTPRDGKYRFYLK